MTSNTEAVPTVLQLEYRNQPVRAVLVEGCVWFDAADICTIQKLTPFAVQDFNTGALDTDIARFEFDEHPTAVLSPIGVWKLSHQRGRPADDQVAAWAKRESLRLIPEQSENDARLRLTLNADGTLPVTPNKYSGRRAEFDDLKLSPAFRPKFSVARALALKTAREAPISKSEI